MKTYRIYAIVNTSTYDAYVGCAIIGPWTRFSQHLKRLAEGTHHSPKLQRAWRQWGADAFQLAVLLDLGPVSQEEARAAEAIWINRLGTYNEMIGGRHSLAMRTRHGQQIKEIWTDPIRRQTYLNRKTRWNDPEQFAKHSEHMKAVWADPERRRKLEARRAARWADPEAKARQSEKMRAYHEKRRAVLAGRFKVSDEDHTGI